MTENAPLKRTVAGRSDVRQGSRAARGWCLPGTVRRFGEKLIGQQLWCWGCDIQRSDDNLLMRFGFERHRDSGTSERSTCYRLDRDQMHVSLWGFGMFFGFRDLGGLYFGRFDFHPTWAPIESLSLAIHWPDQLPIFARPRGESQWQRARKIWSRSLLWVAEYESWVCKTVGPEHRHDCVDRWLRPFVRGEKMSAAWRYLGRRRWEHQSVSPVQQFKQYTIANAKASR